MIINASNANDLFCLIVVVSSGAPHAPLLLPGYLFRQAIAHARKTNLCKEAPSMGCNPAADAAETELAIVRCKKKASQGGIKTKHSFILALVRNA